MKFVVFIIPLLSVVVADHCLCSGGYFFHIHKPHFQENIFILGSFSILNKSREHYLYNALLFITGNVAVYLF